jgi:asparagine synthase (glutamine-hydrolysing)
MAIAPMAHRGPDGRGEWRSAFGDCWLGHVRLAILDLTASGAQPMLSASGRTAIVFNGEIYNHLEVRRSLRSVAWRGHSDTETLVEAWEQSGAACLKRLRGMFAFAVYDTMKRELHLVRDRFGIKPLYFRSEAVGVSFGSEVRVLNGGVRPDLSQDALHMFLATGHLPAYGELGAGISILPSGSMLQVDSAGGTRLERWWSGGTSEPFAGNREECVEEVSRLVTSSVSEHLLSDVPVAVFLSGGTDSSVIATAAAKMLPDSSLRTFTVGFPQAEFDERPVARKVAVKLGSRHTEIEVAPADCIAWIMDGVEALDVPSADAINSFIVARVVRDNGLKVALSGLGGDEIFGGYPSFSDIPRLSWMKFLGRGFVRSVAEFFPEKIRAKLEGDGSFDAFSLALARRRWWSRNGISASGVCGAEVWPALRRGTVDSFAAVSWAEILGYMEPMLLRDTDQMSMAVGLELRVPFLDHRLVEFVLSVPENFKKGGPKRLLIDAFARDLPPEVWNRQRCGFALPMDEWMRGPLRDFLGDGLNAAKRVLNPGWIEEAQSKFERRTLHWTRLWQIAVLGHYSAR